MKALKSAAIAAAIAAAALAGSGVAAQSLRTATPPRGGFFGGEQARRGKAAFAVSCASCHTIDAAPGGKRPLVGEDEIRKWRTVGDLYSRIRRTMPANDVGGLSNATYLDIIAYILQANGLSAGTDLTSDVPTLHRLVLAKVPPDS